MAKHYVYELFDADGVKYVGKGSGRRLQNQKRAFGLDGRVVREFDSAAKAYAYEVEHIAAICPPLNKCKGGNGSRNKRTCRRKQAWELLIERIGSRAYAARLLLAFGVPDASKVEEIRRVAYG